MSLQQSQFYNEEYCPAELDISLLEEQSASKYQIFNNGPDFFNDFIKTIENAQESIIIRAFIWRNDKVGNMVASALKDAADRGVKIIILKDRLGSLFEYGEENGQSFFHDTPQSEPNFGPHSVRTLYRQGRVIAYFYGNDALPASPNPQKDEIVEHPNITAVHQYKLYDHSKVIVVDGETSYVGGVGLGDDFGDKGDKTWIDFMLKINDKNEGAKLLKTLSGQIANKEDQLQFLTNCSLAKENSSIHKEILNFIKGARERIFIEMAFLGHPDFINQITEVVRQSVQVTLVIPKKASSHHFRNLHFIKRLMRQCKGFEEYLKVMMIPQMVHSKVLMRDDEAVLFGSYNLHNDERVFEEFNLLTTDPVLVQLFKDHFSEHEEISEQLISAPSWLSIIIQSRMEYLSVKAQKYILSMWWKRPQAVESARELCRELIASTINEKH